MNRVDLLEGVGLFFATGNSRMFDIREVFADSTFLDQRFPNDAVA